MERASHFQLVTQTGGQCLRRIVSWLTFMRNFSHISVCVDHWHEDLSFQADHILKKIGMLNLTYSFFECVAQYFFMAKLFSIFCMLRNIFFLCPKNFQYCVCLFLAEIFSISCVLCNIYLFHG